MNRAEAFATLKRSTESSLEALAVIKATNPLRPLGVEEAERKRAEGGGPGVPTLGTAGSFPSTVPSSVLADFSTPPRPSDLTASEYDEQLWDAIAEDEGQ